MHATAEWTDVIETAHRLGIPTTSTMMFAHVETHEQRAAHLGYLRDLQRQLSEQLGTKVHLQPGRTKGSGRLVIEFYDLDQFDGLMKRLGVDVT